MRQQRPGEAAFRLPSHGPFQSAEGLIEGLGGQDGDMVVKPKEGFVGVERVRRRLPGLVGQIPRDDAVLAADFRRYFLGNLLLQGDELVRSQLALELLPPNLQAV